MRRSRRDDVSESGADRLVVDITADTVDAAHVEHIRDALSALDGLTVRHVSDATFLMHLGGKLEVNPKVRCATAQTWPAPTRRAWRACASRSRNGPRTRAA